VGSAAGWRRWFEVEDLLLFLWAVALERAVVAFLGSERLAWLEGPSGITPFAVVAVAGALFVAVTESDPSLTLDQALMRRMLLWGPFYPVAAVVAGGANHVRRMRLKAALPAATPWVEVAEVDDWPGPRAPRGLRRAAALPYALLGDALVRHFVGDAEARAAFADRHWFTDLTVPVVSTFGAYLFFVVGPRVAAGASVNPISWIPRFASYFSALGLARWVI
jgi:hypothetical protein